MLNKFFQLKIPLIQAPMAGGITTPELVAAVSNAGALGSLGAGYMHPEEIRSAIRKIKSLTDNLFNVNLFIPEKIYPEYDLTTAIRLLTPLWNEVSNTPLKPALLSPPDFDQQVQIILEEGVPIFSFTFGSLPISTFKLFKKQNTLVFGTATTPEEARKLAEDGVDAIVCQGQEAGGHRGNFSSYDPLYSLHPLLMLTRQKVKVPLIAAGGIMDGHSAKTAFSLGANAVQLGTAFITTVESGAHPVYKAALLESSEPTVLTKAFTGKLSRGILNAFIQKLDGHSIPPYPIQHFLTLKLRALAADKKRLDLMSLWAGQGYPLCRFLTATELIDEIYKELRLLK